MPHDLPASPSCATHRCVHRQPSQLNRMKGSLLDQTLCCLVPALHLSSLAPSRFAGIVGTSCLFCAPILHALQNAALYLFSCFLLAPHRPYLSQMTNILSVQHYELLPCVGLYLSQLVSHDLEQRYQQETLGCWKMIHEKITDAQKHSHG